MQQNICDKYGFDKTGRERRIRLLGLADSDHDLARCLHTEVLKPNLKSITDEFYGFILAQPELASYIDSDETLLKLKKTHSTYLETLGIGFDSQEYFNRRLRVGVAHARIGLSLSYYFAAYRSLTETIVKYLPSRIIQSGVSIEDLVLFVNKIASLDMTLAIDIYHESKVQLLVESLDELEDEKDQLSQQIQIDTLTHVSSRLTLIEVLERALNQGRKQDNPVTIAMLDVDKFKLVNDSHGHLVGDKLLKQLASRILGQVRDKDTVGRYGGEEFLLVFPETNGEIALRIAERIRQSIDEDMFHIDDVSLHVTVSLGLTQYQPGESKEELIKRADTAMYQAKKSGRNNVVVL